MPLRGIINGFAPPQTTIPTSQDWFQPISAYHWCKGCYKTETDREEGWGGEKRCDNSNNMSETEPGNTADDAGADPAKRNVSQPWPYWGELLEVVGSKKWYSLL